MKGHATQAPRTCQGTLLRCMGAMAGVNSARVMLPPRDLAMLPNARLGGRLCKLYSSACALSRMCAR